MRALAVVTLSLVISYAMPAAAGGVDLKPFGQADLVFLGVVESSKLSPIVARSYPPIYTVVITFSKVEMLRGDKPDTLSFTRRQRAHQPTLYAKGTKLLVAVNRAPHDPKQLMFAAALAATDANLAAVKRTAALPPGWTYQKGKPVSPWAALGKNAWPAGSKLKADIVCSKTGRPALPTNRGITLKVDQVIPKNVHEWRNPYGDGKFRVTVTNTNKIEADVPALITDGAKVAWADSLVILCRGKTYVLPTAGQLKTAKATTLAAGGSVSTVVDLLPIQGIQWPRGGSRVHFTFCLGDRSYPNFFYYFSRLHDPLRDAAIKKLKSK